MLVGWIVPEDPKLASVRYRCLIPKEGLERLGVKSHFGVGDVTIVSKHWCPLEEVEKIESPMIFDMCDDHFNGPFDAYYRRAIDLADLVVCSTQKLAERVAIETGVTPTVISDPYEFSKCGAQMPSGRVKNVFWYGHSTNIKSLRRELPRLGGYSLQMVSDAPGCHPWSHQEMMRWFGWCDAVIIPTDQNEKKQVKSPNRMVEAIRNGRYVVANPMSSYSAYGMWQGDILEGLTWASENPEKALEAVQRGQEIVEELHSPMVIAKQWKEAIECLL